MGKNTSVNFRLPGPTPLPPEVLKAISAQMINHRSHGYEEIQKRVVDNLKYFFRSQNDIFLLTSSGMGGLEAAITNFFSPGDSIVSFTCGEFGNRWAEIARRYSANLIQVKFPSGQAVSVEEVRKVLGGLDNVKGVLITHNETATGVGNPIEKIAPIVKAHKSSPLLLIDSISALGATDLPMDKLGIDVLVSASQKAWMAPPGMAFIAVSPKGWEFHEKAKMPHYYFDISMYKEFAAKNQTPATPSVTTLFGLDASLLMMRKEGRDKIFKRHIELALYLRNGIKRLGLIPFVDIDDISYTVTSIKVPQGIDPVEWLKLIRERYHTVLAGGMGDTKGKIIRVAHMGYVDKKDIDSVLSVLKKSLSDLRT